jgi:hypothetical protein
MECTQIHNQLTVKFCPSCGEKVVSTANVCINGHLMSLSQKFCADCGETTNSQSRNIENTNAKSVTPKISYSQSLSTSNTSELPWPNENSEQISTDKDNFKNTRWAILGVSVFALLFLVAVAGGNKLEPVTVTAEMTLVDTECSDMSWGYGDIPGGQVIISVDGVASGFGNYPAIGATSPLGCKFVAYVGDVPADGESYSISMASGRRGTVYNSRSELESNGWTFKISLG